MTPENIHRPSQDKGLHAEMKQPTHLLLLAFTLLGRTIRCDTTGTRGLRGCGLAAVLYGIELLILEGPSVFNVMFSGADLP